MSTLLDRWLSGGSTAASVKPTPNEVPQPVSVTSPVTPVAAPLRKRVREDPVAEKGLSQEPTRRSPRVMSAKTGGGDQDRSPRRSPRRLPLSPAVPASPVSPASPASPASPVSIAVTRRPAASRRLELPDDNSADVNSSSSGSAMLESDYERERQLNIEKNNEMLRSLGLLPGAGALMSGSAAASTAPRRPARRTVFASPALAMPLRRSSRLDSITSGGTAGGSSAPSIEWDAADQHARPVVAPLGDAIAVGSRDQWLDGLSRFPVTNAHGAVELSGHRHAVYSLSASPDGQWLSAAGGQGSVSFFRAPDSDGAGGAYAGSAKLHARWIGEAQFLSDHSAGSDAKHLLVSCADDGTVLLSSAFLKDSEDDGSVSVTPLSRLDRGALHEAGVFSLDSAGHDIVTASKDGGIGFLRVAESALQIVRTIPHASSSVLKCARWDKHSRNVVAACGNDQLVRLFDARVSTVSAPIATYRAHGGAVNSVSFSPCGSRVLSTGFDGILAMFDIRAQRISMATQAHVNGGVISTSNLSPSTVDGAVDWFEAFAPSASAYRTSTITHPMFDTTGAHVIAPSPGRPEVAVLDAGSGQLVRVIAAEAVVTASCHVPGTKGMYAMAAGKNWICTIPNLHSLNDD